MYHLSRGFMGVREEAARSLFSGCRIGKMNFTVTENEWRVRGIRSSIWREWWVEERKAERLSGVTYL